MKTVLLTLLLATTATLSFGATLTYDLPSGQFTTGPLAGTAITGLIEIDTKGFPSGQADTNPLTAGPDLTQMLWILLRGSAPDLTFDLSNDFQPLAGYQQALDPSLTEIDYFGENGGAFLTVAYNGTGAINVGYESPEGELSTGPLQPPAVPEPAALPALLGLTALVAGWRRRR